MRSCGGRLHTAEVVGSSAVAPTLFSLVRGLGLRIGHVVRLRRARYVRDQNRVLART